MPFLLLLPPDKRNESHKFPFDHTRPLILTDPIIHVVANPDDQTIRAISIVRTYVRTFHLTSTWTVRVIRIGTTRPNVSMLRYDRAWIVHLDRRFAQACPSVVSIEVNCRDVCIYIYIYMLLVTERYRNLLIVSYGDNCISFLSSIPPLPVGHLVTSSLLRHASAVPLPNDVPGYGLERPTLIEPTTGGTANRGANSFEITYLPTRLIADRGKKLLRFRTIERF